MRQLGAHLAGGRARAANSLKEHRRVFMLRRFIIRWKRWTGGAEIERQVEEELRFHWEMLTEEYQEMGMPEEAARAATSQRFGDVERVQAECVEISRRNRPALKFLKLVLLLSFVSGLCLRMGSVEINFKHLADLLMATGVLGQLLLHVRGLRAIPSQAVKGEPPLSILGRSVSSSIEAYDEKGRTPVERLVADKAHKDS